MQVWLADLPAYASASRMEPTFRSRMQMQVQEVIGLALSVFYTIYKVPKLDV